MRRHHGLDLVTLEPAVDDCFRRAEEELQETPALVGVQPARTQPQAQRGEQIADAAAVELWRLTQPLARQQLADHCHRLLEGEIGIVVARRVTAKLRPVVGLVASQQQVITARVEVQGIAEQQRLVAMALELKIAHHLGPQQADDVGRDGIAETGMKFLAHGGAPDHVPALEHADLAAPGQVVGRGQAVVARTDDDCVKDRRHGASARAGSVRRRRTYRPA